jgi:hypothetical protein
MWRAGPVGRTGLSPPATESDNAQPTNRGEPRRAIEEIVPSPNNRITNNQSLAREGGILSPGFVEGDAGSPCPSAKLHRGADAPLENRKSTISTRQSEGQMSKVEGRRSKVEGRLTSDEFRLLIAEVPQSQRDCVAQPGVAPSSVLPREPTPRTSSTPTGLCPPVDPSPTGHNPVGVELLSHIDPRVGLVPRPTLG